MEHKIDKRFLKSLNPCQDRWKNYLSHYSDWSGSLLEFLSLDKISAKDKLWVFTRKIEGLESKQREFAFHCAARTVEACNVNEIKEFFTLVLFIYESNQLDLMDSEEFRAANLAANNAADWAAEIETQVEIAKYVLSKEE